MKLVSFGLIVKGLRRREPGLNVNWHPVPGYQSYNSQPDQFDQETGGPVYYVNVPDSGYLQMEQALGPYQWTQLQKSVPFSAENGKTYIWDVEANDVRRQGADSLDSPQAGWLSGLAGKPVELAIIAGAALLAIAAMRGRR